MLPSPLRLTSFPSTKSFNRPDASDVTWTRLTVGMKMLEVWDFWTFNTLQSWSRFMGVLPSKHSAKPKDSFKELWKWEFLWILAMIPEQNAQEIHLSRPMDSIKPHYPRLALPPNNGSLWPNRGPGPLGNLWGFFCVERMRKLLL